MSTPEEFWKWFSENNYPYLFVNEVEEAERNRLFDLFQEQLHAYCDRLYFEMGGKATDDQELIISAEGVAKNFPKVEELVNAAPVMKDWKVIAFKQPKRELFKITYLGNTFDPEKIYFTALESSIDPGAIGIHVHIPDFEKESRNDFIAGAYLLLDGLLGEKCVTLDINYLEIMGMPEDPEAATVITKLPAYIAWKKKQVNAGN